MTHKEQIEERDKTLNAIKVEIWDLFNIPEPIWKLRFAYYNPKANLPKVSIRRKS
jgi:hypothetical protein